MQFSSFYAMTLATLALAAPVRRSTVLDPHSTGRVHIHNKCTFDVQVDTAVPGADSGVEAIKANTTWNHKQINYGGMGQGISLKVSPVDSKAGSIVQVEYTVNDAMGLIFYDLSLINGNPFLDYVQNLTANGAGADVFCAQGAEACADAYRWSDQVATKVAPKGTNLDFYICGQ